MQTFLPTNEQGSFDEQTLLDRNKKSKMPLFEFELKPVEKVPPWGRGEEQRLHWYALTDGTFRINVGNETLFRYSKDIIRHWKLDFRDVEYQIASFLRDILESVGPALMPLPEFFESVTKDWTALSEFQKTTKDHDEYYEAFRWLGERSPHSGYLVACPRFSFYRMKEQIIIAWDNRDRVVDGIQVWEAQLGSISIPVEDFIHESQAFLDGLIGQMRKRIDEIEAGIAMPQVLVSLEELEADQVSWTKDLSKYMAVQEKLDIIPWDEAEVAYKKLLEDFEK